MLCKYCAKLNTGSRCLFCGNKLRTLSPAELEAERAEIAARRETAAADAVSAPPAPAVTAQAKQQNGFAIAGLVLAVVGFSLAVVGFLFPIVIYLFALMGLIFVLGMIFNIIGLVRSKKLNGSGKKLAVAGIVLSVLYLPYVGVMCVFL